MDAKSMRLRSEVSQAEKDAIEAEKQLKIHKKDTSNFPFIQYEGKLFYYTTFIDCAQACDNILQKVERSDGLFPIGFDLEWPFNYQTGSGKVAVIQLSPSLDECYVFQVSTVKNLPKTLTELLRHQRVRLAGVNIKNDIRKLARDFAGVDVDAAINNCVDASNQANVVLNTKKRWSMEKVIAEFFEMRINKSKNVRNSKWHIIPLSKEQQIYAATDAYASLKLYQHLTKLEEESKVKIES